MLAGRITWRTTPFTHAGPLSARRISEHPHGTRHHGQRPDPFPPEQVQNILTVPVQAASIFLSLPGLRIIDSSGPVRVPLLTGSDEPSWHGENELISEVEATFDEVLLLNPAIKSIKSLNRYSNELGRQSVTDAIGAIQERMVLDVAGKVDTTFFTGNGAIVGGERTQPPSACSTTPGCRTWPRSVCPPSTICTTPKG